MARLIETCGGFWCLFVIALRGGVRMRASAYWRWRDDTAFGHDTSTRPRLHARLRAMLDYGRWVWRMKRRL